MHLFCLLSYQHQKLPVTFMSFHRCWDRHTAAWYCVCGLVWMHCQLLWIKPKLTLP